MAKETTEKLTPSEKRAQKRREAAANAEAVFGTGRGSAEPVINPLDYTASMMRALNYYNSAYDSKDKRKWFMSYVGKKSTEFDSLKVAFSNAPKGKSNKAELVLIEAEIQSILVAAKEARTEFDTGRYLVAKAKVVALREQISNVAAEVANATAKKTN